MLLPVAAQAQALTGQVSSVKEGAMEGVVVSAKKVGAVSTCCGDACAAGGVCGADVLPEVPQTSGSGRPDTSLTCPIIILRLVMAMGIEHCSGFIQEVMLSQE
jgi:hypothetical protein